MRGCMESRMAFHCEVWIFLGRKSHQKQVGDTKIVSTPRTEAGCVSADRCGGCLHQHDLGSTPPTRCARHCQFISTTYLCKRWRKNHITKPIIFANIYVKNVWFKYYLSFLSRECLLPNRIQWIFTAVPHDTLLSRGVFFEVNEERISTVISFANHHQRQNVCKRRTTISRIWMRLVSAHYCKDQWYYLSLMWSPFVLSPIGVSVMLPVCMIPNYRVEKYLRGPKFSYCSRSRAFFSDNLTM